MPPPPADLSTSLLCHVCGYDLRAAEAEGVCPECGGSVAEARRQAAIPRRPAWRDSDPRWRRRMLAGVWILTLLPAIELLLFYPRASQIPVPSLIRNYGGVQTLDQTLFSYISVYRPVFFTVGAVLLFARERYRQKGNLDWTRRWGVACSYIIALICTATVAFISALVLAGIAALFQSMPPKYQPSVTHAFVEISYAYLRYGPQPGDYAGMTLKAFSAVLMVLAFFPLFDALRSCGLKVLGVVVLAPLCGLALIQLVQSFFDLRAPGQWPFLSVFDCPLYFRPDCLSDVFTPPLAFDKGFDIMRRMFRYPAELAKWLSILICAIWLTIAQVRSWRHKSSTATN